MGLRKSGFYENRRDDAKQSLCKIVHSTYPAGKPPGLWKCQVEKYRKSVEIGVLLEKEQAADFGAWGFGKVGVDLEIGVMQNCRKKWKMESVGRCQISHMICCSRQAVRLLFPVSSLMP